MAVVVYIVNITACTSRIAVQDVVSKPMRKVCIGAVVGCRARRTGAFLSDEALR
jgi:hypothetical protein